METKTPTANAPVVKKSEITDSVLAKINQLQELGQLRLPKEYSAENALKSAYLLLVEQKDKEGKPVLESCSKESIANSLLKMVIQGLSVAKGQCCFIPYGKQLNFQRQYFGDMALAKRVNPKIVDINGNIIYKKDNFSYSVNPSTGKKTVIVHEQKIDNINLNEILGAYATVSLEDGTSFIEPMTMAQIETAWNQGATKGNSPAHKNFKDQMSIKTVIRRACKLIINSSSDADLFGDIEENEIEKDAAKANRDEKNNEHHAEEVSFEEVKEDVKTDESVTEKAEPDNQQQETIKF